jgi:arsenite methyltransferase
MTESPASQTSVARFYERALRDVTPGCCAPQQAVPILATDYSREQLASLPTDAVANSFGCGNPLAFAQVKSGQSVLDLGSGAGIDLIIAAETVGPTGRVIGVDISPEMVERARANVERAGHANVEIHAGEMEAIPLADASVDWVVSNCVINLSPDKPKVFGEIARVLKPGGQILVSDIIAHALPDWVLSNADLYAACISGALTEADYIGAATSAGLADVKIVDRLVYDGAMIAALIVDQLPVSVAELGPRLGFGDDTGAFMDFVLQELDGKIESVKVAGRKHKAKT